MQIEHDIHLHTYLSSCCSDENAVPENILKKAHDQGLKIIGFSDHMWDRKISGPSNWYSDQDYNHISKIKDLIPKKEKKQFGIKIYFGCETEYCGNGKLGIAPETAAKLDYLLIPFTHFHMEDFVRPADIEKPDQVASLMVERFMELMEIELPVPIGIAHPFYPCGFEEDIEEIIEKVTEKTFDSCFSKAADKGISLEIQPANFSGSKGSKINELYRKMYSIALDNGCFLHFGSDAHSVKDMKEIQKIKYHINKLDINKKHLWPILR